MPMPYKSFREFSEGRTPRKWLIDQVIHRLTEEGRSPELILPTVEEIMAGLDPRDPHHALVLAYYRTCGKASKQRLEDEVLYRWRRSLERLIETNCK